MQVNLSGLHATNVFQSTESKKEDFRKYLEKGGVIDQLTQVLVGLYEEPDKPDNAIEYITVLKIILTFRGQLYKEIPWISYGFERK